MSMGLRNQTSSQKESSNTRKKLSLSFSFFSFLFSFRSLRGEDDKKVDDILLEMVWLLSVFLFVKLL